MSLSNIMIVYPNHHVIIRNLNPRFDRTHLAYVYSNGFTEELKTNLHL